MGNMQTDRGTPSYRGELNERCTTVAQLLQRAGYTTLLSGKWHVTHEPNRDNWPLQRGFDRFYGILMGAASFFDPYALYRDNERIEHEAAADPDYYFTDAISDHAARFIDDAAGRENPFLLFVTYTAPHWPLHARDADIAKYKGSFNAGWDRLRHERYERMRKLGVIDERYAMTPRDEEAPAWDDTEHKDWQQRRMEVYAAQIEVMDEGIGRILAALKRNGADDNTLVAFFSDNGACHVEYGPKRTGYWSRETTRDGRPMRVGNLPTILPGGEDTFASYGREWANLGNTPFRYYKSFVHEGGIRAPLIVRWPGKIEKTGGFTDAVAQVMDFMPTCLELAGATYPENEDGRPILPLEGRSLVPILRGTPAGESRRLFWEYAGNSAAREGDWKIVATKNKPWELYNLAQDPTEMTNLAAKMPRRVETMAGLYQAWVEKCGVIEEAPHSLSNSDPAVQE
jgi:arylsulfatase